MIKALSSQEIIPLLKERGISLKKRWGQNFLVSPQSLAIIVRSIHTLIPHKPIDTIWEIGAGLGALTHNLIAISKKVVLFEVDYALIRYLQECLPSLLLVDTDMISDNSFSNHSPTLITGDALDNMKELWNAGICSDIVVGNLPYRSATAIMLACAWAPTPPAHLVFLVQKEVAERVCAAPNSGDYSSMSVALQSHYRFETPRAIPRRAFFPSPHVDSSLLLGHRIDNYSNVTRTLLEHVVRASFRSRRATLYNNLHRASLVPAPKSVPRSVNTIEGIDLARRAETLSIAEFKRLTQWIATHVPQASI